jgi:hypothetical protein
VKQNLKDGDGEWEWNTTRKDENIKILVKLYSLYQWLNSKL